MQVWDIDYLLLTNADNARDVHDLVQFGSRVESNQTAFEMTWFKLLMNQTTFNGLVF